jgi:hypothetical protein
MGLADGIAGQVSCLARGWIPFAWMGLAHATIVKREYHTFPPGFQDVFTWWSRMLTYTALVLAHRLAFFV